MSVKRLLIVCEGNVGRSPLLGVALQVLLGKRSSWQVSSAGLEPTKFQTAALKNIEIIRRAVRSHAASFLVGKNLSESKLREILNRLQQHHPQRITAEMISSADLVLTMNPSQRRQLITRFVKIPNIEKKIFPVNEFIMPKLRRGKYGLFARKKPPKGKAARIPNVRRFPVSLQRTQNISQLLRSSSRIAERLKRFRPRR